MKDSKARRLWNKFVFVGVSDAQLLQFTGALKLKFEVGGQDKVLFTPSEYNQSHWIGWHKHCVTWKQNGFIKVWGHSLSTARSM